VRLVLDASVAVAAARPREPGHRRSRARIEAVLAGTDTIVVPTLFGIEVAASLARVGVALPALRLYVDELLAGATVVPLGARAARQSRETAMRWRLRAADAVYVWAAGREGVPLCTLDAEIARRASAACAVMGP
jgi:predicted nucleic acid-binding protein